MKKLSLIFLAILIAATFDIGLTVLSQPAQLNATYSQVNQTIYVDRGLYTINIPIIYSISNVTNVSVNEPSAWYNETNFRIYENGSLINIATNSTSISWQATPYMNANLYFEVPAPTLTENTETITQSYYEKNVTVSTPNHFSNVTFSTNVSQNHSNYNLYWFDGNEFVDKTNAYNLVINNGTATVSGFNTSDQYFSFQAYCTESWSCTAWSGGNCGTRSCTDANSCGTTLSKPSTSIACSTGSSGGGGGGGGGGGSFIFPTTDTSTSEETSGGFLILANPETISIDVAPGERKLKTFLIGTDSLEEQTLYVTVNPSSGFVSVLEKEILISPSVESPLTIEIDTPRNQQGGVQVYEIELLSNSLKIIRVYVNVIPKDITTAVNTEYDIQASKLYLDFEVFNYKIQNTYGDVIFYLKQGNSVRKILKREDGIYLKENTSTNLQREISVDIDPGNYELCADIISENETETDCKPVIITKPPVKEQPIQINNAAGMFFWLMPITIVILLIIGGVVVKELRSNRYLLGIPKRIRKKHDLAEYLENLRFRKSLEAKKIDIADFVKYVFDDGKLSDKIRKAKTKKQILDLLYNAEEKPVTKEKEVVKEPPKIDETKEMVEEAKQLAKEIKDKKIEEEKTVGSQVKEIATEDNIADESKTQESKQNETVIEEHSEYKPASEVAAKEPEKIIESNVEQPPKEPTWFDMPPEDESQYFYLQNGVAIKTIKDLLSYLHVMPDDIFNHHVTNDRNDFANWIEGVFHNSELATQLRDKSTKDDLIYVLDNSTKSFK